MTQNIDEKIAQYQSRLEAAKAEVAESQRSIDRSWLTKQTYTMTGSTAPTNINTAPLDTLVLLVADLVRVRDSLVTARRLLGLTGEVVIQGHSFDDWLIDCTRRVAVIRIKERTDKVARLTAALEQLMSPEARRLKQFENLEAELKDL